MSTPRPANLVARLDPEATRLLGGTGRYEKRIAELAGVFADEAAFEARRAHDPDELVYDVDEYRPSQDAGDLIFGTSRLQPGRVGDEFHVTRGHIHAKADRTEIYHCLRGTGLLLLEDLEGHAWVEEMTPGDTVYVPPRTIHRSVNTGDELLVSLFCYPADAGQDYDIIARSGGMALKVVTDGAGGWTTVPNERYVPRTELQAADRG